MATPHVAGLVALCIGEGTTPGPCAGLAPADVIRTMRQAAAGRPATDGFVGDLNRPWAGVTFGNLAAATAAPAAAPLPPAITIADTTVVEPASSTAARTFAVTLSAASTTPVTVDYQTVDGTAAAPADFTTASGTVTFNPGETAKTLAVSVVGDGAPEASETFTVMLDSPTGATIADGSATATIVDPTPAVRISDASVSERTTEAVTASFTVTLSSASYDQVQVSYQTATSTAVAPADFTAASGVLTFLRGERSKTITMTVAGDALDEGNEVFLVRLALVTANATLGDGSGTGTIVDDDAPPTISVANRSIIEGNSGTKTALVTVRLSAPSAKTVSVRRSTADGTARAGSDYTGLASAPLSFSPGQTSKTVAVTIRGDVTREANETFLLRLASPTNVTVVRSQATVTITNDD
jgi:chitinase